MPQALQEQQDQPVSRRAGKSAAAFRTISEVASQLGLPQHVLRFWETKFPQIRPMKRGGNRRYYRPEDVDLLKRIRALLYDDGYTIKGVQKLLRQNGTRNGSREPAAGSNGSGNGEGAIHEEPPAAGGGNRAELKALLSELTELRDMLRRA